MVEEQIGSYIEGLSGNEVVRDILFQIAQRLNNDCHLGVHNSYPGGYSARISFSVKLHSIDTAESDGTIIVGKPRSPEAGDSPATTETVEGDFEIPREEELNTVRDRSNQGIPTLVKNEEGQTEVRKRKYAKPDPTIASPAKGAAIDEDPGQ